MQIHAPPKAHVAPYPSIKRPGVKPAKPLTKINWITHTHTKTHTHTHLLGMAFRIDEVECIRHAKNTNQKDKMKHIHIYIYTITGVNDNIKQQQYTICPPQLRLKCAQGRDYIYNKAGTFTQEHCSVFVGRWLQCSPAAPCIEVLHLFRWYTHTHTLPQQGGWDENEHEMKMTMRWELPNRNPGRGTKKKGGEKRRKHQHDTPGPEQANPEKAREKKSGRTAGQKPTRGGGEDRSAWHNLQEARATPTSAREGPQPNLTREQATHEIGDPWGPSWWKGYIH